MSDVKLLHMPSGWSLSPGGDELTGYVGIYKDKMELVLRVVDDKLLKWKTDSCNPSLLVSRFASTWKKPISSWIMKGKTRFVDVFAHSYYVFSVNHGGFQICGSIRKVSENQKDYVRDVALETVKSISISSVGSPFALLTRASGYQREEPGGQGNIWRAGRIHITLEKGWVPYDMILPLADTSDWIEENPWLSIINIKDADMPVINLDISMKKFSKEFYKRKELLLKRRNQLNKTGNALKTQFEKLKISRNGHFIFYKNAYNAYNAEFVYYSDLTMCHFLMRFDEKRILPMSNCVESIVNQVEALARHVG